jgi:hypothetical protein
MRARYDFDPADGRRYQQATTADLNDAAHPFLDRSRDPDPLLAEVYSEEAFLEEADADA